MTSLSGYFIALLMVLAAPAGAQQIEDIVDLRLLPGWRQTEGAHMAALEITLADGWKTYWRAPGDGGLAPRFDWQGSANLSSVEVIWPAPEVISQGGVETIGYEGQVIVPLRVRPGQGDRAVQLSGRIEIGVCRDICVPVTRTLSATLRPDISQPDPRIVGAMASRPFSAAEAGVTAVACTLTPRGDDIALKAEIDLPRQGGLETVIIETGTPAIRTETAQAARQGGRLVAETLLKHARGAPLAGDGSDIRLTILGDGQAVDIQGCPAG